MKSPHQLSGAAVLVLSLLVVSCRPEPQRVDVVGERGDGSYVVSTRQVIRPAGQVLEFSGRPVDLVLSPDGRTAYAKDVRQLLAIDVATWTIRQSLAFPERATGTMHGIAVRPDGGAVYVGAARGALLEAIVDAGTGKLGWGRQLELPGAKKAASYPCGISISADASRAYVCLSMSNSLGVVDLAAGKMIGEIPVGVAPYGVAVSPDGKRAYVSNWGGRQPRTGERTADSAGTPTLVDERGVASSGTVGVIDLDAGKQIVEIATGLHPSDVELSLDGGTLYVANANSDTVSVIDTRRTEVRETITVRPDPSLPFGSAVTGVCLSKDGQTLYASCGGNNAVAVVRLGQPSRVEGFIPAGWYPAAVVSNASDVLIANAKGFGSRGGKDASKRGVKEFLGTLSKVSLPDAPRLKEYSAQVRADALVPQTLRAFERSTRASRTKPVPVPKRVGDPSVFEHCVYIIKENRTYDQVFGDIEKGNGDPALCIFGRQVSPNHHALAEQFVLLDNFYCNGVVSADGHAWATEGLANDYLEKSFGSWPRSYPFRGDDPLAFASSGFIWDNVLLHGLSFRNYGEMSGASLEPSNSRYTDVYNDHVVERTRKIKITNEVANESLRRYTHPTYPGWSMKIPDLVRAEIFIDELRQFEAKGTLPNLVMIFLPGDHTSGTGPNNPTPASQFADNDLALGRIVEAISTSRFWPKTCIFVIEDDPQAGFDHVDGHRSIALVVSPYTKRGAVVSEFYNQTSVLRTMELILAIPPMNQMDAMAPAMRACFTAKADLTPYRALPNEIPLNEMNPPKAVLSGRALELAEASERLPLDAPDKADEDTLNRILWHSVRGADATYPAAFAGPHGRGLGGLKLKLDETARDEDDDDD